MVERWDPLKECFVQEGGAGSGNFNHGGRPGEVGGSGEGGNGTRRLSDYRGIKDVSFAPQGTPDGDPSIAENKKVIDSAIDRAGENAVAGISSIYVTGGGGFLGSAAYIPPTTKKGYASDDIMLMQGWMDKTPVEKEITLLHEIGHRQQYFDKPLYTAFKNAGLGQHFGTLVKSEYHSAYKKQASGKDVKNGESFAQSYALHKMGMEQPHADLTNFWKGK